VKIRILKAMDLVLGCFAVRILGIFPAGCSGVSSPNSILFIRPGGIGDAVHLIPVIKLLKNKFPDVVIDVLAERRNSSVFALTPKVRSVKHYDMSGELLSVLMTGYDVVIDTEQWQRLSAVVARLVRADVRIGFATNERTRMFNFPVQYSHDDYEMLSFLKLLEPLGISASEHIDPLWLEIPKEASTKSAELLSSLMGNSFVTIFPGASIPERRWGADRFRDLAGMLADRGIRTVVVGGAEDAGDGDEIVRGIPIACNLAGKTSLLETAAVIDRCAVLVSGDSGILHIGVGLGKPTVSLFGPGISAKWAPAGGTHVVINRNHSCSPCTEFGYTPRCKIGAKCISEILPDEVCRAVFSLMDFKKA